MCFSFKWFKKAGNKETKEVVAASKENQSSKVINIASEKTIEEKFLDLKKIFDAKIKNEK